MDWIVAAVFVVIGVVAAVALYWARRDPLTKDLNLGGRGLFMVLGRLSPRRRRDNDADNRPPPAKQQ